MKYLYGNSFKSTYHSIERGLRFIFCEFTKLAIYPLIKRLCDYSTLLSSKISKYMMYIVSYLIIPEDTGKKLCIVPFKACSS